LALTLAYLALVHFTKGLPPWAEWVTALLDRGNLWCLLPLIPLVLLPLALTMALLWKTKEVILDSVFGPKP
jgi:hypothetical protein